MAINDSNKTDQFDNEQAQLVHNDVAYQGATETTVASILTRTTDGTQKTQITDGTNSPAIQNVIPAQSTLGWVVRPLPYSRPTYSSSVINLVPAAAATDVFTITGSATKTIYIHKIEVTATKTAHSIENIVLVKRSTANSGGTSALPAIVPHDSNNSAATAVVRSYTANPTLGTLVGNILAKKINAPVQTPSNAQGNMSSDNNTIEFGKDSQPIILRGVAQQLSLNLNSVTWAGGQLSISIEWSEE